MKEVLFPLQFCTTIDEQQMKSYRMLNDSSAYKKNEEVNKNQNKIEKVI